MVKRLLGMIKRVRSPVRSSKEGAHQINENNNENESQNKAFNVIT